MLSRGPLLGLSLTAAAGALSAGAILVVVYMVARHVVLVRRTSGGAPQSEGKKRPIVKTHVDAYMISLLVSDLLQAVGAMINVHHVRVGRTECSVYCTAQGVLKSLGEPSAAMATLAITIHTFCVICFHWSPSQPQKLVPCLVISAIWLYVSLYVGIAYALHHKPGHEFFQPVPYWCWVANGYPEERISAEYIWLWLSVFGAVVLYVPLWLVVRGNVEVSPWRFTWCPSRSTHGAAFDRMRQSLKMLLYPAVYIILVLPLSVTRWIMFSGHDISSTWTFVGIVPFHLSGLGNVLLLLLTRPSILVFGKPQERETTKMQLSRMPEVFAISVHVEEGVYDETVGDKSKVLEE
ncbi:hypothetical protein EXIGLDRAFT_718599 [Exidia glandulosa HHB12029]|uniref:Uncharacterized protein n=1 Tax=Exidia glandulosa HHB12029 TaxID=1314781 RepID=A0A165HN28_EXIGL|nr:hypothetical protein EXIGLDRAFT_718599 [Exidia glandulosa HHB12029]